MPVVDLLKALGAVLIVLHHLAFYGPMSDVAYPLMPRLIDALYAHGRLAVQLFLVVGGFLAARSLAPQGLFQGVGGPGATRAPGMASLILRRYVRLVGPFAVALLAGVVASALALQMMQHDSITLNPTLPQFLAHLLLVHDLVGVEALQAGVWYVAIDFQLFVLMVLAGWLSHRPVMGRLLGYRALPWLVLTGVTVSALWANRDPAQDSFGWYFFASYGLGALAYWAGQGGRPRLWMLLGAVVVVLGLWLEWRLRLSLALGVALVLYGARRSARMARWQLPGVVRWLSGISYSVFLIHFPVCLLINGLVHWLAPGVAPAHAAGLVVALAASLAAGHVFHHRVELPMGSLGLTRWGQDKARPSAPTGLGKA